MRFTGFFLTVLLAPPLFSFSLRQETEKFQRQLTQVICNENRAAEKTCSVALESATQNELAQGEAVWGLTFSARTKFSLTSIADKSLKTALDKMGVVVLNTLGDHFTGIGYFKSRAKTFERINLPEFMQLTLNPVKKVVARLEKDFLRIDDFSYTLSEAWQAQGATKNTKTEIQLRFTTPSKRIELVPTNLEDNHLPYANITACTVIDSHKKETPCAESISTQLGEPITIKATLELGEKLKAKEPAFKLTLKDAENKKIYLSLAIPFKPRPNYFMFGLTGFLFGALMAVMALVMRSKVKPRIKV